MRLISLFFVFVTTGAIVFAVGKFTQYHLSQTPVSTFLIEYPQTVPTVRTAQHTFALPIESGSKSLNLRVADNWYSRFVGLSNQDFVSDSDRANDGMIFLYDTPTTVSFVMRNMRFNLDFAFVDETGTVVKTVSDISRNFEGKIDSPEPILAVIEIPPEHAKTEFLKVGATVKSSLRVFSSK